MVNLTHYQTGSFQQRSQSPVSKSPFDQFKKNYVLRSRLDGFEVSLGARTRHRRSPFKFLVCAILTENLLQQQRRRQPEGRTSFHKQQIAPRSVSNQLLVFYFATVSFFFFCLCVIFVLKIQPLRLRVCMCMCVCVLSVYSYVPALLLLISVSVSPFQIIFASYILKYNNRSFYHY